MTISSIERLIRKHGKKFFPCMESFVSLHGKRVARLSPDSFVLRYFGVIKYPEERERAVIIRVRTIKQDKAKLMKYLWRERAMLDCATPRPLLYIPSTSLLFYEELEGETLRNIESASREFPSFIKKIAVGLRSLHALPLPNRLFLASVYIRETVFLKRLGFRANESIPLLHDFIVSIIQVIIRAQRNFAKRSPCIVHNDFQASNIIVTPQKRVGIIDFSLSSKGSPVADIANFLTHSRVMLGRELPQKRIGDLQELFLKTYLAQCLEEEKHRVLGELPFWQARSALDIIVITAQMLHETDPHRERIINNLVKFIKSLDLKI